jgi:hypothetical protein
MTVCYLAEALEHQMLDLNRGFLEENDFQVDIHREDHRIFSAKMKFRWE